MNTSSLKVLAMWQPWAAFVVASQLLDGGELAPPPKGFETRHWAPRGTLPISVAIHATKTVNADVLGSFRQPRFAAALKRCGYYASDPRPFLKRGLAAPNALRLLPFGAIIGVADVVEVLPTTAVVEMARPHLDIGAERERWADELAFGFFDEGRFAWRFANQVLLPEPVAFTGKQEALYDLPGNALEAIAPQLARLGV